MKNQRFITIKNFSACMSVGIYDAERRQPQAVLINLVAGVTGDGADYVCYHKLYQEIEALCASRHFDLLEELAEEIADLCFARRAVETIDLTIEKPDAIKGSTLVGIKLIQSRS